MNIQDLETKYKELGAEIERLKQQPVGVWEPEIGGTFWKVDGDGIVVYLRNDYTGSVPHHNVYKTEALAKKASVLQRRANLVIQACLNFDPDFVPDWDSFYGQVKWGFSYNHSINSWVKISCCRYDRLAAYVSTSTIANEVLDYLNNQEIN